MATDPASQPYRTAVGIFGKGIDDLSDPTKNHPPHDAAAQITYGQERYELIAVLDGVSESGGEHGRVTIAGALISGLADFCYEHEPVALGALVEWFGLSTRDPAYAGQGNTTVALLRLDRQRGVVDGFTAGDSPVLLALDRLQADGTLACTAEVLVPLHNVTNHPDVIVRGWRQGEDFTPEPFHFELPLGWESAYLVAMSDGYRKLDEAIARELYDNNEADRLLAHRFPDFARVYLPGELAPKLPAARRDLEGRVLRESISGNADLWTAISEYYDGEASDAERRELEVVDLDCGALRRLQQSSDPALRINGRDRAELLDRSHHSLQWLLDGVYVQSEDESDLEDYLRQYLDAELFIEALIATVFAAAVSDQPLPERLAAFGEALGPIADDFTVALMQIRRGS